VQMNTVDEEKSGDFNLGSGVETLTFGAGPYLRVDVEGASLALTGLTSNGVGAELSGDFAFEQSSGVTKIGMNNVTVSVDVNGSAGSLEKGEGAILVTENGVAGTLEGEINASVGGAAAGGKIEIRFNNTGGSVDQQLEVSGVMKSIIFSDFEGNILTVSLLGGSLNIADVVTVEGDVTFTSQGVYKVFAGNNMTLFVGDGPLRLDDGELNPFAKGLMISEATVGLLKKDGKYALSAKGQVSVVGISGLSLSGPISISYNGFDHLIDEAVAIAGTTKRVAVNFAENQISKVVNGVRESFYDIKGFETPIAIDVAGQRVRANFSVRRFASVAGGKDDSLEFGLTNVEASFGDGTSDVVTLTGGSGALLSMPDGVALQASGSVSVSVSAPEVSLTGTMKLKINNVGEAFTRDVKVGGDKVELDLPAGPYTKFEGAGSLVVAGQTLEGDFVFEKNSAGSIKFVISGLNMNMGNVISINNGYGEFQIDYEGMSGAFSVSNFEVKSDKISFDTEEARFELNTRASEFRGDYNLGRGIESVTLDAGPYVRLNVEGANLSLAAGLAAELYGDFAFEQSGEVTRLGVSNVSSVVELGGSSGKIINGSGANNSWRRCCWHGFRKT